MKMVKALDHVEITTEIIYKWGSYTRTAEYI